MSNAYFMNPQESGEALGSSFLHMNTRLSFEDWPGTSVFIAVFFFTGATTVWRKCVCVWGEVMGVNHLNGFVTPAILERTYITASC